jgi:hypothetical protein
VIDLASKLGVFKEHQTETVLVDTRDSPTTAAVIRAVRNVNYDVTGLDHAGQEMKPTTARPCSCSP